MENGRPADEYMPTDSLHCLQGFELMGMCYVFKGLLNLNLKDPRVGFRRSQRFKRRLGSLFSVSRLSLQIGFTC